MSETYDPFHTESPADPRYAVVEVFGKTIFLLPDGRSFTDKEALFAFLDADAVAAELKGFEQYLRDNAAKFFTIPGKEAKPERAGTGRAAGKTLPAREAVPARVIDGTALESAITRMVRAAGIFKNYQAVSAA